MLGQSGLLNYLGIPKQSAPGKEPYPWENVWPGDNDSAFGWGFEIMSYIMSSHFFERNQLPNLCEKLHLDCEYSWYAIKRGRNSSHVHDRLRDNPRLIKHICGHGEKKSDMDREIDEASGDKKEAEMEAEDIRREATCSLACYNRARNPVLCHRLVVDGKCDAGNPDHVLNCAWSCQLCNEYEDKIVNGYLDRLSVADTANSEQQSVEEEKTPSDVRVVRRGTGKEEDATGDELDEDTEEVVTESIEHCEDMVDTEMCRRVLNADKYLRMLPIFRHSPQAFMNTLSFSSLCRKTAEMCFEDDQYDPIITAKQIVSFCFSPRNFTAKDQLEMVRRGGETYDRDRLCGGNLFDNGEYERILKFSNRDKTFYSNQGLPTIEEEAQPLPKRRSSRLRVPKHDPQSPFMEEAHVHRRSDGTETQSSQTYSKDSYSSVMETEQFEKQRYAKRASRFVRRAKV
eukprot:Nk52_evm20s255 gene=Nk52_evmTU20s255